MSRSAPSNFPNRQLNRPLWKLLHRQSVKALYWIALVAFRIEEGKGENVQDFREVVVARVLVHVKACSNVIGCGPRLSPKWARVSIAELSTARNSRTQITATFRNTWQSQLKTIEVILQAEKKRKGNKTFGRENHPRRNTLQTKETWNSGVELALVCFRRDSCPFLLPIRAWAILLLDCMWHIIPSGHP